MVQLPAWLSLLDCSMTLMLVIFILAPLEKEPKIAKWIALPVFALMMIQIVATLAPVHIFH